MIAHERAIDTRTDGYISKEHFKKRRSTTASRPETERLPVKMKKFLINGLAVLALGVSAGLLFWLVIEYLFPSIIPRLVWAMESFRYWPWVTPWPY